MAVPDSQRTTDRLKEVLAQLSLRSLAYWGMLVIRPCFDLLRRQKWWYFGRRRAGRFCEAVLEDLVAGRTNELLRRVQEASRIAERLTLNSGNVGRAGEALYSFFSQFGILVDALEEGNGEDWKAYCAPFIEVVAASAEVAKEGFARFCEKAEKISSILLDRCGPRGQSGGVGKPIEKSVRDEIDRIIAD
jgi:hypothetical protein